MSKCENCDRPLATKQDAKDISPGEGEHLCWGACEPEDWRARALKAEQQVRELAEVAARNVNDAQHLLRDRDEARAEVVRMLRAAAREPIKIPDEDVLELALAVERLDVRAVELDSGEVAVPLSGWEELVELADSMLNADAGHES